MNREIEESCNNIWTQCMGLSAHENALIVTDDEKKDLGDALYRSAKALGANVTLIQMPVAKVSGEEPPASVSAAMMHADVIICPTEQSITHTAARIQAVKNGARIATMPGITEKMFREGPICADYSIVEKVTDQYAELLTQAASCRVITERNHEIILNLSGRKGIASTGVYRNSGQAGNLPSGEAYIAPLEDGANGEFCVNGSIVGVGILQSPIILKLKQGRLIEILGDQSGEVARAIPDNTLSRTIGELGIGTNTQAHLTGIILEDEKISGSIHLAFGTNVSFGGTVKASSHIDCVTLNPTVYFDDVLVIQDGKFLLS